MSSETLKFSMRGPVEDVFGYLKTFNPNEAIPNNAKSVFSSISAVFTGKFNWPTLAALRYFCDADILIFSTDYISRALRDEIKEDEKLEASPSMYDICSLCELAASIHEDTDIPDREYQGGLKSPMIPMAGIISNAQVVIPPHTIQEFDVDPGHFFSTEHNQFGLPILPNKCDDSDLIAARIYAECLRKINSEKLSMFLNSDKLLYKWYDQHYFGYAGNKEHVRKFTLASILDTREELPFFGVDSSEMSAKIEVMKSYHKSANGQPFSHKIRAVATTPIRDLFAFMLMGGCRIVAIRKMSDWVNNPIDVSPTIIAKYAVRLSEPVASIKRTLSKALTKEPRYILPALDSFFNGHMVDYVLELDNCDATSVSQCGYFTPGTETEFAEFMKIVDGVLRSVN